MLTLRPLPSGRQGVPQPACQLVSAPSRTTAAAGGLLSRTGAPGRAGREGDMTRDHRARVRRLRARAAAYAMHAQHDSGETSRRGREAFLARFERQVDPDGAVGCRAHSAGGGGQARLLHPAGDQERRGAAREEDRWSRVTRTAERMNGCRPATNCRSAKPAGAVYACRGGRSWLLRIWVDSGSLIRKVIRSRSAMHHPGSVLYRQNYRSEA